MFARPAPKFVNTSRPRTCLHCVGAQEEFDRVHREWVTVKQALDEERTLSAHRIEDHAAELREASRRAEEMHKALQTARDEAHKTKSALEVAESQVSVCMTLFLLGGRGAGGGGGGGANQILTHGGGCA